MREVLDGYAKFLQEKDLALDKHQPYLVRWVAEFLRFARAHAGYSFEQTLDLFLAEVGGRVGTKPWQLQQASDAIRIYRYQYRGAKAGKDDAPAVHAFVDDGARLERLREVIRLRHCPEHGEDLSALESPLLGVSGPRLKVSRPRPTPRPS
ncbi:MAG TPA: hypothetical protein PK235_16015 [Phycisphaerae bacterium]|nr:hypothetical protein [Phycisphaerae bacterium]